MARFLAACVCLLSAVASAFDVPTVSFDQGFSPLFGDGNLVRATDDRTARLLLDRRSGSGFISSDYYLHGFFSASIKLPRDYTAGVVVAFYDLPNTALLTLKRKTMASCVPHAAVAQSGADQRVRQRQHQPRPGGALPPPLRPHPRTPPLLHPLGPDPHHLLRRRHADPRGGSAPRHGRRLPGQAHGGLRHHLGRLRLGHRGRQVQGQLQVRALRLRLLRPLAPRLPRRRPGGVGATPHARWRRRRRRVRPPRAHDGGLRGDDPAEARRDARVPGAADDLHGVLRRGAVRGRPVPRVRQLGRGEGRLLGVGRVQDRRHEDARPRTPWPEQQGRCRHSQRTHRRDIGKQLRS